MHNRLATLILALLLAAPGLALAHEGHPHKVMGTIAAVEGPQLVVKTTDGKTATVVLDAKTKITQGKAALAASALKPGDRVVATGAEEKGRLLAATLQVGISTAPASRQAPPAGPTR